MKTKTKTIGIAVSVFVGLIATMYISSTPFAAEVNLASKNVTSWTPYSRASSKAAFLDDSLSKLKEYANNLDALVIGLEGDQIFTTKKINSINNKLVTYKKNGIDLGKRATDIKKAGDTEQINEITDQMAMMKQQVKNLESQKTMYQEDYAKRSKIIDASRATALDLSGEILGVQLVSSQATLNGSSMNPLASETISEISELLGHTQAIGKSIENEMLFEVFEDFSTPGSEESIDTLISEMMSY